ncbi:hypothetical protein VPH35_031747 [Triticum aestivum]|uniref:Uncharacterized protein n=1 Tax=Triticum aestivum TaxID=4565 RepID=A0A3B6CDQ7_WHEAT
MAVEVDDTRKRGAAAFLDDPFEVLQAKQGRCSPSATRPRSPTSASTWSSTPSRRSSPSSPAPIRSFCGAISKRREMSWMLPSEASGIIWHRIQQRPMLVPPHLEVMNTPANRTEWAELIVKEMSSASYPNDARNRVFRILEMFDKCAANCSTPDEAHKMRETKATTDGAGEKVSSGGDKRGKE